LPLRLAVTIAGVALLLPACGGSSKPFAASAEAICASASKSLAAVPAVGLTLAQLAKDVAGQLPIYEKQLNELSALHPPAADQRAYAKALSGARTDVALLHQLYSAMRAGNGKRVHDIALEGGRAFTNAGAAMRTIGLARCTTSV
jgi:hypothetical protein